MTTRVDAVQARELIAGGIRLVDVLPARIFEQEHLPGAGNLPLETFEPSQVSGWDRAAPVLVYCFDQHCDLSGRATARLESLGFGAVHDLIGGRAAWTALGYPTEGSVGDRRRIAQHVSRPASVPVGATVGELTAAEPDGYPVPVLDDRGVVVGAIDPVAARLPPDTPVADVMIPAPGTIRGEMRVDDVVQQLAKDGIDHVLVTAVDGSLIGRVVADELHV